MQEFRIPHFVFSSSCTVYGNPAAVPVTEDSPTRPAESPYGSTKQMGEEITAALARTAETSCILLRYFNPAGAHPSAIIGETPLGKPENLVPVITQTAIGRFPKMRVHGNDYPTRDGSCIRDYIHVCDIAHAHTLSLRYLEAGKNKTACEVFNLGSGNGVSVLEMIRAFEKTSGVKLNYEMGPRRPGDVIAIYANNDRARAELGWEPRYTLEDMMASAWKWEQQLKRDEDLLTRQDPDLN